MTARRRLDQQHMILESIGEGLFAVALYGVWARGLVASNAMYG